MTLEASAQQEAAILAKQLILPSTSILQNRVTPLDSSTSTDIARAQSMEVSGRVGTAQDLTGTFKQTDDVDASDGPITMQSHIDYYSSEFEVWGVRSWAKAWIPSVRSGNNWVPSHSDGCITPINVSPFCKMFVLENLFTLDLTNPDEGFVFAASSLVPVPRAYGQYSWEVDWVELPNYQRPYNRYVNTLVGILLAPIYTRSAGLICGKIHVHGLWNLGPAHTTGKAC